MIDSCSPEHMNRFKELQMHCLQNEFDFNDHVLRKGKILEKEQGTIDSVGDYAKKYFASYVEGLGDAYCTLICHEKDCEARKIKFGNLKKKLLQYKITLENENPNESFSLEKVWELYLFKLGPSFWKAVTDIAGKYLFDNINQISDESLKTLDEI